MSRKIQTLKIQTNFSSKREVIRYIGEIGKVFKEGDHALKAEAVALIEEWELTASDLIRGASSYQDNRNDKRVCVDAIYGGFDD